MVGYRSANVLLGLEGKLAQIVDDLGELRDQQVHSISHWVSKSAYYCVVVEEKGRIN